MTRGSDTLEERLDVFGDLERRVRLVRISKGRYRTSDGLFLVVRKDDCYRDQPQWDVLVSDTCNDQRRRLASAMTLAAARGLVVEFLWKVLAGIESFLRRAVWWAETQEDRERVEGSERKISLFLVTAAMTPEEYERRFR